MEKLIFQILVFLYKVLEKNKMKNALFFVSALLVSFFLFFPFETNAASLFLTPSSANAGIGGKITIDVKIDSEGVSFNASQVVIRFPKDILEVSSVDKTGSTFSFWLEEPNFSNNDGIISFIGGTPYGMSGASVQVLKIVFTAKGSGNAEIAMTDAAITSSDGSGANILSKVNNAVVAVSPTSVTPKISLPQQIIRKPVLAEGLPEKPNIKISLYPDEKQWYNTVGVFSVNWDLPLDISGVSTALDKQPNFIPPATSEGLFDNKAFDVLSDGTQYLHVRFKNNIGWGQTAHQKISIDTQPPFGFVANTIEGQSTDNPSPTLQFKTSDALSGIKEYQVRIDNEDLIKIPAESFFGDYKTPLLAPGEHRIVIKAVDNAGNSVETNITINIIPINSPVVTFVTNQLFSDNENGLAVKGTALPDVDVLLSLNKEGTLIDSGVAHSDQGGNWDFTFNKPLKNGNYIVKAQSRDGRGALSLSVDSSQITVENKPIIQIGALQIGAGGLFIILLLIIMGGIVGGYWFYKKRKEKINLRTSVAEGDLEKISNLVKSDIEKIKQAAKTPTTADDEFAVKSLGENVEKMEKYLKKGIEKIKE
jgi:hypothetical protein